MKKNIRFLLLLTFNTTLLLAACGDYQNDDTSAVVITQSPDQSAKRLAIANTTWHLQFEKPATADETLRILGSKNEMVEEILFQLPYGILLGISILIETQSF